MTLKGRGWSGPFVLFLNKGNVGKQSSISGAVGEGQDPTFRLHDDRLWAVAVEMDNGGSVERLRLGSEQMHFN